jgi:hypothetical protein
MTTNLNAIASSGRPPASDAMADLREAIVLTFLKPVNKKQKKVPLPRTSRSGEREDSGTMRA